jgi:hypothetical protein
MPPDRYDANEETVTVAAEQTPAVVGIETAQKGFSAFRVAVAATVGM